MHANAGASNKKLSFCFNNHKLFLGIRKGLKKLEESKLPLAQ